MTIDICSQSATDWPVRIIRKTEIFAKWLDGLRDIRARARILVRIQRLEDGNEGDIKPVGSGIYELRINYGPGYRVYFCRRGKEIIILLAGGTKGTQRRDIQRAFKIEQELEDS